MKEVANSGWKPDAFFLTSQCQSLALMKPAGAAAQGVMVNLYYKDPSGPEAASDAGLQNIVAAVQKYQPGSQVFGGTVSGYSSIEVLFHAAELAEKSPLGLSRLGLLYAVTHMTFQPTALLSGVEYSTDYPKDQVALEAAQLSSFDASSGHFAKVETIDVNGQTTGQASS